MHEFVMRVCLSAGHAAIAYAYGFGCRLDLVELFSGKSKLVVDVHVLVIIQPPYLALRPRQRNQASVLTPLVNQIPDAETAERDAFAQFTHIGHGLGGRHCLGGRDGWFLLGEGFQDARYYLFGRVVTTSAEVRRDELLAVRVQSQGESHGSV